MSVEIPQHNCSHSHKSRVSMKAAIRKAEREGTKDVLREWGYTSKLPAFVKKKQKSFVVKRSPSSVGRKRRRTVVVKNQPEEPLTGTTPPLRIKDERMNISPRDAVVAVLKEENVGVLNREEVLNALVLRFPGLMSHSQLAWLSRPCVSTSMIQEEFWRAAKNFKTSKWLSSTYMSFVANACSVYPWYRHTVNPNQLINDAIWQIAYSNPFGTDTEGIFLSTKIPFLKYASKKLTMHHASLSQMIEDLARSVAGDQRAASPRGRRTFWHGTNGSAGRMIYEKRFFEKSVGAHDFGPGIYVFDDVFHAACWAIDRAMDTGNPCIAAITMDVATLPPPIDASKFELNRDSLEWLVQSCGKVDKWSPWERFVKYCRLVEKRPSSLSGPQIITGPLHDAYETERTDTSRASKPIADADGWHQSVLSEFDPMLQAHEFSVEISVFEALVSPDYVTFGNYLKELAELDVIKRKRKYEKSEHSSSTTTSSTVSR